MAEKNKIVVKANRDITRRVKSEELKVFSNGQNYECLVDGDFWETVDDTGTRHIIFELKSSFDVVPPEKVPAPVVGDENIHLQGQLLLLREVQQLGHNVVTCGNCGDVLIHKTTDEVVLCPHCGYESDPCDFPDLFY